MNQRRRAIENGRDQEQRLHAEDEGEVLGKAASYRAQHVGAKGTAAPRKTAETLREDHTREEERNAVGCTDHCSNQRPWPRYLRPGDRVALKDPSGKE